MYVIFTSRNLNRNQNGGPSNTYLYAMVILKKKEKKKKEEERMKVLNLLIRYSHGWQIQNYIIIKYY